jgi:hypothetical protein
MRLNEKAKENLEAAERLLDTADGEIEALMTRPRRAHITPPIRR